MKNKVFLLTILLFLVLVTCGTVAAANNTTERISISTGGNQSNGESCNPSISADGRYVTFTSYASNLVPGDNNGVYDIFVRDRVLGITTRISINNLVGESNGDSSEPAISSDGRFIVFSSYATNLVANDNNDKCDIFLYDNNTGKITRLTVSNMGNEANDHSKNPTINGNGNLIAFISDANNLVEGDTNNYSGLFIYNRNSSSLEKVDDSYLGGPYFSFYHPSISADGSYLAFTIGSGSLFIYNILSKTIEEIKLSWNGEPNSMTIEPSLSADGRYVAVSSANHMISDTLDRWMDVYIYDQFSKNIKIISSSTGETSFYSSYQPTISADGHTVAFSSISSELISNDTNNCKDIFVYSENYPLTANINPDSTKSGDIITIQVSSNPNTVGVFASILDNSYSLTKGSNGVWFLSYLVPQLANGFYPVEIHVIDNAGNQRNVSLGFVVDNTPPTISGIITPDLVKSGDYISVDALTTSDTISVTALINGETFNLNQQATGWNLSYLIPNIPDGTYNIILTATDKAGNQNTTNLYFTVDNTPPVLSGSVTPDTVKTNDNLIINAISGSDTELISALILDQAYTMVKQDDGNWILEYCTPYASNGNYPIILTATDKAGNQNTLSLSFNLFNPLDNQAPSVSGNVTHCDMMYGKFPSTPWIHFLTLTDNDTISVTASVLNKVYALYRQEDGSWAAKYSSWLEEGNYTALLTAQDWSGNQGTQTINFTVRNISPTINFTISSKVKSGDTLVLTVNVSPDPWKVCLSTLLGDMDLEKQDNGSWTLNYIVPHTEEGYKYLYIKCLYEINWFSPDKTTIMNVVRYAGFTLDNTPPIISVSIPNPIKSGDVLKISCITSSRFEPDDASIVTVNIFGQTLNLNWTSWINNWSRNSGIWNVETIIPKLPDGTYSTIITATDDVGNQITKTIDLTIDNTPPNITAIITPNKFKYIDFNRPATSIIAESSPDVKEIHAYFENGSKTVFNHYNDKWTSQIKLPLLLPLGTYVVKIKAFDYAGNEAESSATYYVYKNLNVNNPLIKPSESGSDSPNNNNNQEDRSSTTGSSTGTSTVSTGSSAANVDDPSDGKPFLKLLLNVLLLFGDIASILFLTGCACLFIAALIAVWAILGFFTGLFVLFAIALIVVSLILVIYLIYRLYTR